MRDNLADKFARPIINQDCGGRGEEWNKSWELPDNHRLTLSINFVNRIYPTDIIQGMFGFDGRKSGPCLWFSIAKLLLSAENTNAGKKVNHVVNILKENN